MAAVGVVGIGASVRSRAIGVLVELLIVSRCLLHSPLRKHRGLAGQAAIGTAAPNYGLTPF